MPQHEEKPVYTEDFYHQPDAEVKSKSRAVGLSIAGLLADATQEDLDQLNGRIAELEAELPHLRAARDLLAGKLKLKPGKKLRDETAVP